MDHYWESITKSAIFKKLFIKFTKLNLIEFHYFIIKTVNLMQINFSFIEIITSITNTLRNYLRRLIKSSLIVVISVITDYQLLV